MPHRLLSILTALALLGAAGAAKSDDDHERAREALRAGRILPLERIVADARDRFGGDILDVELEDEESGFRYELKVIDRDGRILKLEYDAASGALLQARGRHHGKGERR